MEFKSLDEVEQYIKSMSEIAMNDCADEMVNILKSEIERQVKGWEGHLFDATRIVSVSDNHAEVEVADNKGWKSLVTGESFKNAMYGLEGGYTWNREQSNIMEKATEISEIEIPNLYKLIMNGMGIPMK